MNNNNNNTTENTTMKATKSAAFGDFITARKETNKLMDMMNEGLPAEQVVLMCLKYMSESDVADMMDCNELSDRFNEDNN